MRRRFARTGADTSYAYDRARVELENLCVGFHPTRLAGVERPSGGRFRDARRAGGSAQAQARRRAGDDPVASRRVESRSSSFSKPRSRDRR